MDMSISPTLRCICEKRYCQSVFKYDEPPMGEARFDLRQEAYHREYTSCSICKHLFGNHNIDLGSLYGCNYVDATYGGRDGMVKRLKKVLELPNDRSDNFFRVRRIEDFYGDLQDIYGHIFQRTLLDIGAGIGVFPYAMKALGWIISAIEPDVRTASHLREEVGINAFNQDFLKLSPKDLGKYSLVTFNKVLEHLEDPVSLLAHAKQFLLEEGICYLEVPDIRAAEESFLREEFYIEHHHIFSISSCVAMAEKSGFRVLRVESVIEPSGKYTIFAFLSPNENQG